MISPPSIWKVTASLKRRGSRKQWIRRTLNILSIRTAAPIFPFLQIGDTDANQIIRPPSGVRRCAAPTPPVPRSFGFPRHTSAVFPAAYTRKRPPHIRQPATISNNRFLANRPSICRRARYSPIPCCLLWRFL